MTVAPVTAIQRLEELLELPRLVEALRPQRLCEIGTSADSHAVHADPCSTRPRRCIDRHQHPPIPPSQGEACPERQSVRSLQGDSHDPTTVERPRRQRGHRPLDFLFIDGDHAYAGVKRDVEIYAPLVRPGGLVALRYISPDADDPGGPISRDVPRVWPRSTGSTNRGDHHGREGRRARHRPCARLKQGSRPPQSAPAAR